MHNVNRMHGKCDEKMKELHPGDQGILVSYMQLALKRAGYDVTVDGDFGPKTCRALESFIGENKACVVNDMVWNTLLPYLRGFTTHIIKSGDSLYNIAKMYRTTLEMIRQANPGAEEDNLQIGTMITVPYRFDLVEETIPYTSLLTEWVLDGLQARYPYAETGSIGMSVMGSSIPYIKIGNGPTEVAYNASFHANESITTPVLLKFAEQLLKAYVTEEPYEGVNVPNLLEEFTLYLVPLVNPDGVDLVNGLLDSGRFYREARRIASTYSKIAFPQGWKANIRGVDLNLQFPAGWEEAKRIKFALGFDRPAPRDYVGPMPLSEPESVAMYQFTKMHDFALILAYHTQGEVIYWRYLNYEPEKSYVIAQYFTRVSGYAVEETPSDSGYAGYKDWFIQEYDRPGYTIEAGKGINPLPMDQFDQIYRDNVGILLGGMTELE